MCMTCGCGKKKGEIGYGMGPMDENGKPMDKLYRLKKRMDSLSERLEKAEGIKVGTMVSWGSSGGTARGKVVRIKREGSINVPDSSFSIKAEEDNPAVLIRLYKDGKPTDTMVGHKMGTLSKM